MGSVEGLVEIRLIEFSVARFDWCGMDGFENNHIVHVSGTGCGG